MDKLDLIYLPFVYVLRLTAIILHLLASFSGYFYEYWFNTSDSTSMRSDVSIWILYFLTIFIRTSLYLFHIFLKLMIGWIPLMIGLIQYLPLMSIILWWPKFYWHIFSDPNGRSLFEIMLNPRYSRMPEEGPQNGPQAVPRKTRRRFIAKGKIKICPIWSRHNCLSSYQVQGAHAHEGQ